jgi:hypothetical protein
MWEVFKPHALDGRTPASFLRMLKRMGKSEAEIAARRAEHERYIDEALSLAQQLFDVEIIIQAAADRSMEAIPHLWR